MRIFCRIHSIVAHFYLIFLWLFVKNNSIFNFIFFYLRVKRILNTLSLHKLITWRVIEVLVVAKIAPYWSLPLPNIKSSCCSCISSCIWRHYVVILKNCALQIRLRNIKIWFIDVILLGFCLVIPWSVFSIDINIVPCFQSRHTSVPTIHQIELYLLCHINY